MGKSFKICSILPNDAVEMLAHLTAFIGPHEHFTYFKTVTLRGL